MVLPFEMPPPAGLAISPVWTGNGFLLGENHIPVLEYSENFAGWSDDLTTLHEESAGDAHPIDVASRRDALAQLHIHLKHKTAPVILEIGCSSGFMLKEIVRSFPAATVIGADVVKEPLYKLAKDIPGVPLIRFDLLQCPLPSQSFDAIVILNVLEHIEDDVAAMKQLHRLLKPGGIVVIEVPAGPHLYDSYDKALMHFRRYRLGELSDKLKQTGLQAVRKSHLGFLLYPAFAFVKRRNQRKHCEPGDLNKVVKEQASTTSSSGLLKFLVELEARLSNWISYPVGIRCLVVGKRLD